MGTLIEHYAGAFPVWLAPTQILLIPIQEKHAGYAQKIKEDLQSQGLRVIIDTRNESLNKRIREGTLKKIPYILIMGDKEIADQKVAVRKFGAGDQGSIPFNTFMQSIQAEIFQKKC